MKLKGNKRIQYGFIVTNGMLQRRARDKWGFRGFRYDVFMTRMCYGEALKTKGMISDIVAFGILTGMLR